MALDDVIEDDIDTIKDSPESQKKELLHALELLQKLSLFSSAGDAIRSQCFKGNYPN